MDNRKDLLLVVGGPGGSGSSTIAKMLAEYFHLRRVYAGGLMRENVYKLGYKTFEDFYIGKNEQDLLRYDIAIDNQIAEEARKGNVLIESKIFAAVATVDSIPCTVKIWITASLHRRALRKVEKSHSTGFSKIKVYFDARSDLKKRWVMDKDRFKKLYGVDYNSPHLYNDVIVDSTDLDVKQTFDLILKKINDGGYLK